MSMIPLVAGGVLLGLLKQQAQEREFNRQKNLAGEVAKWSPWSGIAPNMPNSSGPGLVANAFEGGLTGASLGQGLANLGQQEAMSELYKKKLGSDIGYQDSLAKYYSNQAPSAPTLYSSISPSYLGGSDYAKKLGE